MTSTARILVICGDSTAAAALTKRLNRVGYAECGSATSAAHTVGQGAALHPDLLLVDLDQEEGVVEAGSIRGRSGVPVVYLVGEVDESLLQRARDTHPVGYVVKPLDDRQLRLSIEATLSQPCAGTSERERHDEARRTISELQRRIDIMNAVVDGMTEGVVVADPVGSILFANRVVKRMFRAGSTVESTGRLTEGHRSFKGEGVETVDNGGGSTIFNPGAERMLGTGIIASNPDDWPAAHGLFLSDRTTPFPADQLPLARALRGEFSDAIEMFVRNPEIPEGTFFSVTGKPLRDANESLVGGVAILRDLTKLKDTEEELQRAHVDQTEQNRFMELVFDSISDGVVVADSRGRLTMANASAKRIVGMGLTASPSEEWSALYGTFYPDRTTPFPSEQLPLVRAINGESTNDVELFIRNPHVPEGVHISVSGRPLQERSGGEQSGGVIVFRDVTQWLRTQDALNRAFDRGRLEVIETVLHNIGNAINSVATGVETIRNRSRKNELVCRFVDLADAIRAHEEDWIDWLSHDEKGRKVRSFLLALVRDLVTWNESLKRTAERTSSRVRHVVDIIRTQETFADSTVERKVINLEATIADAVKVLEGSLTARAITVDVDCSSAPEKILVQENAFNQLLVNLLKNAMEAIEALVKLEPDLEHADRFIRVLAYVRGELLAIDVIDSGVGIAPEYSREIFKAGYTTKVGGTGLGLHSAAIFVGACGGSIEAESGGVGCGTTLKVTLPLNPC